MSESRDVIEGALKLIGLPQAECWTNLEDFIKWLVANIAVEVPPNITNVIVSNVQPSDSQRDCIWFRRNNSGGFMGIFIFNAGAWKQLYPVPNQLFRIYGNSNNIPDGFALADNNIANISTDMFNFLKSQWMLDPGGSGAYFIFDVVYIGF